MKNPIASPRLGIVTGAGPMAGALLFERIIQVCQEQYHCQQDDEFPCIMMMSYPFANMLQNPSLDQQLLIQAQLSHCLSTLAENGVELSVIACNTLHLFLDYQAIQDQSLIHMIEEVGRFIEQNRINQPLVLCTNTAAQCTLHKRFFGCVYPGEKLQLYIQELINKILAGQQSSQDAQQLCQKLNAFDFSDQDCMGIVLGCTEFSVFHNQFPLQNYGLNSQIRIVDPNQIIAEKICQIFFNY